jgi:8-oxo-dGTP pyrophosphatase MutT (NUDIX family)
MEESLERKEKVAAGGVVLNDRGEVLLVHRPTYDDWSFPKGGVDKGESIEEAALREVREEAGPQCEITRRLSEIRYFYTTHKGETRPKVVHYFLMTITGGQILADGRETDQAVWCSFEEAARRLSYQGDKDILKELL